ncbi:MAG: FAD-binding oxidoreductase [Thermodesulfobacteriota bacterium]
MSGKNGLTDVIIIGGGVIGTAIAFYLTRNGAKVILLEKEHLASGSSGACDGTIFLQTKKPGLHLQLALESSKRFPRLKEELPVDIEYRQAGGLVIIETEAEYRAMQSYTEEQRKIGLDVSLLAGRELRELEPRLAENILGVAYSPWDGQVNPMALTLGYGLAARKMGADIRPGTGVTGLEVKGNRIQAVNTSQGRFEADFVVNAAGVHAPEIAKMVDINVPITPRRGQLLVTEAAAVSFPRVLLSAKYVAVKFNPDLAKTAGEGLTIEQTANGNFLLGSTREFVGFDKRTTMEKLHLIAKNTSRVLPCLRELNAIRAFAGLRPYTPDGYPILGPVAGLENFIMAAGHEGDGIALSPITGELIAQYITNGRTEIPLSDFRLERFDRPPADSGKNNG